MPFPEKCLSESIDAFNYFMNINELLLLLIMQNRLKQTFMLLDPSIPSFESLRLKNRMLFSRATRRFFQQAVT